MPASADRARIVISGLSQLNALTPNSAIVRVVMNTGLRRNMAQRENEPSPESVVERHPLSQMFHDVLEQMGKLHDMKQADYGVEGDPFANVRASQDFGIDPWVGAILRGNDKMARIKSFIKNGELKNESVTDSLMDLAVYSIISLILFEQQHSEYA